VKYFSSLARIEGFTYCVFGLFYFLLSFYFGGVGGGLDRCIAVSRFVRLAVGSLQT
jgi:hypothetical protein